MGLFMKAEVTSAFLKMGVMGFAGSGKTYTSAHTAIGLVEYMQSVGVSYADKPVFFLDTETGSDWVIPQFGAAGIPLFTAKTRAFQDLLTSVKEAERDASLLLVDSISHFWKELCEAYMKRKNRNRLQFEDWSFLKGEWSKFTDLFINSQLHIIICGRAGYEYDYFQDDSGKKQLEKTGIKMKAEGEMGYEPSLLVLMEREMDMETLKVSRTASIIKDRSTAIDGKKFHNPTFDSFMPHIKYLNLGGRQLGVDVTRTSESSIPADERDNRALHRKIVLDEIESLLIRYYPGQSGGEKKTKLELIKKHFQASWTEIEKLMPLIDLRAGYDGLHRELENEPSRYAYVTETAPEMNDSLPGDLAPPPVEEAAE
jgi:KaiC/GvpD/RAD55 family RecA-like ATPase